MTRKVRHLQIRLNIALAERAFLRRALAKCGCYCGNDELDDEPCHICKALDSTDKTP